LIVAADVMTASPDFGHLGPMVAAARAELAAAGVTATPAVVVADAGYWHLKQMNELTGAGIPVLIPPDSSRRKNKPRPPGWDGGAYDFMRSVLATDKGGALYKQRTQLIEPIFGTTKHNRGFTRFHRAAAPPSGPSGASWHPRITSASSTSTSTTPTESGDSRRSTARGRAPPRLRDPPPRRRPLRDSLRRKQQRIHSPSPV
jgi:hypothetical protein